MKRRDFLKSLIAAPVVVKVVSEKKKTEITFESFPDKSTKLTVSGPVAHFDQSSLIYNNSGKIVGWKNLGYGGKDYDLGKIKGGFMS